MTNKLHDLITRMAKELDDYRQLLLDDRTVTHRLSNEARAALAKADGPAVPEGREPASVTEQPSDEDSTVMEIIELASEIEAAGLGQVDFARAVLARWGRPTPQPPADGEVAELVAWLREQLHVCLQAPWTPGIKHFGRAAELLERLSPPQPVPVSERPPGPEDCDAEGRCWIGYPEWTYSIADTGDTDATTPEWRLERPPLKPKGSRCYWLPAHALPLPLPEVGE